MNVTPLIDVLLVLLDHLHGGAAADAEGRRHQPAARDRAEAADATPTISQIVLEYTADRSIAVNKQRCPIAELETRLRDIFETRKDKTMFIVGDPYAALRRHRRGHRRRQGRRRREGRHRHRGHAQRSQRRRAGQERQLAAHAPADSSGGAARTIGRLVLRTSRADFDCYFCPRRMLSVTIPTLSTPAPFAASMASTMRP